jgi:hypothetical protein
VGLTTKMAVVVRPRQSQSALRDAGSRHAPPSRILPLSLTARVMGDETRDALPGRVGLTSVVAMSTCSQFA